MKDNGKAASVGGPRTETRDRNPFFRQENPTVGCSEALAGSDTRGDCGLIEATLALKKSGSLALTKLFICRWADARRQLSFCLPAPFRGEA